MRCDCCTRRKQLITLIEWLHNLGITYEEIGKKIGLTRQGVRYLHKGSE